MAKKTRIRGEWNPDENDWFFETFDRTLNSGAKGFLKLGLIAILANILIWGTLIVLAAWAIGTFIV